jgi:hypothetical protein
LRDAFAADPRGLMQRLGVGEADRAMLLQLSPVDLEFQARVLLRKRFDLVRRALPRTCAAMGEVAWPEFSKFARSRPAADETPFGADTAGFCEHVRLTRAGCVCAAERERVRFAGGRGRFAVHLGRGFVLHVFLRLRGARWHEWRFFLRI